MNQIEPQVVISHQAAQLYQKDQTINQLQAYAQQIEGANKGLAERYKQLQERAGLAKEDPLYINFEAPVPSPAPQSLTAAVKTATANRAQRRAKKA
jgi:hypothetical protein